MSRLFGPGHGNAALQAWLQQVFEDKRLGQALKPVVVPTFDAATGEPRVWKTDHDPRLHGGTERLMREVALASAATPTYLPAVQFANKGAYLDGGLWANNPSLVGLVEARRYKGASLGDIVLLSVGTGSRPTWLKFREVVRRGIVGWGRDIVELVFAAQSASAHNQARLLLQEGNYLRIDVQLARHIALDDVTEISDLENLGESEGSKRLQDVKRLLRIVGLESVPPSASI